MSKGFVGALLYQIRRVIPSDQRTDDSALATIAGRPYLMAGQVVERHPSTGVGGGETETALT